MSKLKVGAVSYFNLTVLHSISLFCTDLGLIDMLLTNQTAEIVACILLRKKIAVYFFQISLFVPEIFKLLKYVI